MTLILPRRRPDGAMPPVTPRASILALVFFASGLLVAGIAVALNWPAIAQALN